MNTPSETNNDNPKAESSLRDLLGPISDYKSYILVFCISTILSSLILTYVYSEKYMAATTIVFQPQEVTRIRQKEMLAFGAPLPQSPFDLIYDNLQLLVQSEPILLRVIEDFGLHLEESKEYKGPWYIRFFKWTKDLVKQLRDDSWTLLKHGRFVSDDPQTAALKGLREHLSLINHNSYVFYLSFIDKDPKRAALIVDRVAEYVVETLLERQKNPGVLKRQQLQSLRDAKEAEIDQYQNDIKELLTRNSTASVSLQIDKTMNEYSELVLEEVQLRSKLESIKAKLSAIQKQGVDRPVAETGMQPEDYKLLKSEKIATRIELEALNMQYESLLVGISKLDEKLAELPKVQYEYDILMQKLKTAQRDFIQISDPYHEAEVQANSVISEVYLPHKARVPSVPVSPIKIYHVALAGVLAISISFGMAYLLAFARSEQVSQAVSRAVGNVVSMWDGVNRRGRDRRRENPPPYDGPERRKSDRRLQSQPEERD